jgi:hypothetical protein
LIIKGVRVYINLQTLLFSRLLVAGTIGLS